VHEQIEEKSDDSKDSFYKEREEVFDNFSKFHMKIILGDFNAKLGREDIFKPTNGNDSLHWDNNDNGVSIVHSLTPKNLVDKIMINPQRNIHKYTWISADTTILRRS
jgi:hypothetical protein